MRKISDGRRFFVDIEPFEHNGTVYESAAAMLAKPKKPQLVTSLEWADLLWDLSLAKITPIKRFAGYFQTNIFLRLRLKI